ncbi:hypothetical protein ACLB2K_066213 [Fragaria x ananassa]
MLYPDLISGFLPMLRCIYSILRSLWCAPLVASARSLGDVYVSVPEFAALKYDIHAARNFNFLKLEVEGDSSLIINCINGKSAPPRHIKSLIKLRYLV